MKANWQKERVMRLERKHEVCNVKVNDECVERVREMKYLCAMISSDDCIDREVELRKGMISKMVGAIGSTVLRRKELMKGTKYRVVNVIVIPTLTYGCEAWALQAKHKERLQAMQMWVLHWDRGGVKIR